MRARAAAAALLLCSSAAFAQTTDIDTFKDAADDAKVHESGFVCPLFIGHFERDAFGERSPSLGSDFCAYSARDGVYGTITLTPLKTAYDPKTALAADFAEQEGIGGKFVGEKTFRLGGGKTPVSVYTRVYETAAVEAARYRILFSGGTVGGWALEATVEFATPRDDEMERGFLDAVYAEALKHIAAQAGTAQAAAPATPAPLAGPAQPR